MVKSAVLKSFLLFIFTSVILAIAGYVSFNHYYNHYDQIVQERIQTGFWQSRSGIYAAPRTIRIGQKIERENLISLLKRSGYIQGKTSDKFWNGAYKVGKNSIEITSNQPFEPRYSKSVIEIENGTISNIKNNESTEISFEIKPELLTGRSEAKRGEAEALKFSQIPENLRNAIIVTEDRRFFEHNGIDYKGILRAVWVNLTEQKILQGGSTITQQLVKNTFLSNERTFRRKFAEAFLAFALEDSLSKQDIFTLYCNEIYLGQYGTTGIHGFGMASEAYFDKDITKIDLTEAATLAAIIRSPNYFTLGKNEKKLRERRNLILSLMYDQNLISSNDYKKAIEREINFVRPKANSNSIAPYFIDSVVKEIPNKTWNGDSAEIEDLQVFTTIDTNLQNIAEKSVAEHIQKLKKNLPMSGKYNLEATLIAMDPHTGEVLALVGGSDYAKSQYNRVTQAKRQPGSVFKPFVYAAALEKGYLPSSVFTDQKTEFDRKNAKTYVPANYGNSYSNKQITLKTALAKSSNVVAVKTALNSGIKYVSAKAENFGFENVQPYPSMALGTMEVTSLRLASAYSSFVNRGKKVEPVFIKYITSGDGSIIYQSKFENEQIISEKTAYLITDMLKAVVENGTARKTGNQFGKDVVFAGKTGSSKDAWFVGYTPNLVTVAWVGFDENEDIGLTGGDAALPLWSDFMKKVLDVRPEFGGNEFEMPDELTEVTIDPETGMLVDANCPRKEKVVVPKSSVSNFICFRHRVYPEYEYTYAYNDSNSIKGAEYQFETKTEINTIEKIIKNEKLCLTEILN